MADRRQLWEINPNILPAFPGKTRRTYAPKTTMRRKTEIANPLLPPTLQTPHRGHLASRGTAALQTWLTALIQHVEEHPKPFSSLISEFQSLIESDPAIFMLFGTMFRENQDSGPSNSLQIRDYRHMLRLMNELLTRAPEFSNHSLAGVPINTLFDRLMGSPSGIAAFLDEKVNAELRKILDQWAIFLSSSESVYCLNDGPSGWLGQRAMAAMKAATTRQEQWTFPSTFICNTSLPHFGFTSWDDFFTRRFRPGVRPVAFPEDDDVITNPCESAPYRVYSNVEKTDEFWIKGQPYSIYHVLAHDQLAQQFVGGTIYQAYLCTMSYHRWHSPISGTIVKAYIKSGTYYACRPSDSCASSTTKTDGNQSNAATSTDLQNSNSRDLLYESQAYITAVATRALIFIQADNPAIGLMCLIPVGIAECSSCDVTVSGGQHVKKGEEIGMFHFGGSIVCMLFRREVELVFDLHGQENSEMGVGNVFVNERIATVKKP